MTADAKSRGYRDADPALTYSGQRFGPANGDTLSGATGDASDNEPAISASMGSQQDIGSFDQDYAPEAMRPEI